MNNEKLHKAELNVAKEFIRICLDNKLTYYVLGGTLLGAVRHNGFIPWDDDMDFGMPREDYEKFLKLIENNYPKKFIVNHHSMTSTHDYQLKLESTEVKIKQESKTKNPWIDILPLDGMPNNRILKKIHSIKLLSLRALYKISHMSVNVAEFNPYRTRFEKIIIFVSKHLFLEKVIDEKKILNILDKSLKKYPYLNSDYVVNFMGAYKLKEMFPKEIYKNLVEYPFEDIVVMGPKNYDYVLKQLYGDYMTPPKDKDKNKHSTEIL